MNIRNRVLDLIRVKASDLIPHPDNWRSHGKQQRAALKGILAEVGIAGAVLVRKLESGQYQIIDGHLRSDVLKDTEVPALVLDLDDLEAKKLLTVMDPIGAMAGADAESLDRLLKEVSFDDEALAKLIREVARDAGVVLGDAIIEDEVPAPQEVVTSEVGDLWELGDHRLLCGDSTRRADVERVLAGEKPRLLLTDPPYGMSLDMEWRDRAGLNGLGPAQPSYMKRAEGHKNTSISGDTKADWSDAFELVPSLDTAYVWHASAYSIEVGQGLRRIGFEIKQQIIWRKPQLVLSRQNYHWQHEPCWYARKAKSLPFRGARDQTTIWDAASPKMVMSGSAEEKHDHPTQKPVALYTRPIENHLELGACFFEPFGGSGTGIAAAEQLRRRCLAIEIDPRYVDVIVRRWQKLTGRKAKNLTRPAVEVA